MDHHRHLPERIALWIAGAAAVLTGFYTVILGILVDGNVLVHQFKAGALTPWIILTIVAWTVWLVILTKPMPRLRRLSWAVVALSAAFISALAWMTLSGSVDIQDVPSGTGRFQTQSDPSDKPTDARPSMGPADMPVPPGP
ncbi:MULTISPECIES: hypothetical protein [Streptomyces]|uniref:hypothetical protein n=1 Tax=Streptomyces TaxID=1883 RepID=UPI0011803EEC|nr:MULTISPECIES: hypothetical protein [Streptomyces]MCX4657556.1 hypothetical protein [Streptomyces microflavus]